MDDQVSVKTHSMVRTSRGTIPGGTKAGLPREEAEKLERAGHLTIVEDDEGGDDPSTDEEQTADIELPEDYNELRYDVAAELEERTGIEPEDYERATLEKYVKKHAE
ncbi:MAG: hypothetical protein ABEN55_21685 [Bradymonadaceae bacterium]